MDNYEAMYKVLFNGITDALHDIEQQNFGCARDALVKSQQVTEEIFMESDDSDPFVRLVEPVDEAAEAFKRLDK